MRPTTGFGRPYASSFRALALALLLVLGFLAQPAAAEKSDQQLKQERADVLAKKAKAAAQVNALKADDAEVGRALDALQGNVASQRSNLQGAEDAEQKARVAADAARDAEAAAQEQLRVAQANVRAAAVSAYVQGGSRSPLVDGNDIDLVSHAGAYGAVATGRRTDAVDELDAARKDLERLAKARAAAMANAEQRRRAAQQRLLSLTSSLADQQRFAEAVADRLDATLSEAEGLAAHDKALSEEIKRREAALAARLAKSSPRNRSGGGGGGSVTIVGDGEIVSVHGIQVHRSIASQLGNMLSAADGAGLALSGGGYRSSASQVALRKQNCSGDPYTAPASSCSPPTARPGQSMHERGLAIDFTCSGRIISSRSSPCFQWLNANARGYGFYNLPSEPWHWSTNGN